MSPVNSRFTFARARARPWNIANVHCTRCNVMSGPNTCREYRPNGRPSQTEILVFRPRACGCGAMYRGNRYHRLGSLETQSRRYGLIRIRFQTPWRDDKLLLTSIKRIVSVLYVRVIHSTQIPMVVYDGYVPRQIESFIRKIYLYVWMDNEFFPKRIIR